MSGLIRAKLQSKHINRSQYSAYIQYEPNGEGTESVKGYTCRCKNGLRTVGMCSHLTGLIWYLSQGKHKALPINGRNLKGIFDMLVVEEIDSDNE
jgi:hypothetical protein